MAIAYGLDPESEVAVVDGFYFNDIHTPVVITIATSCVSITSLMNMVQCDYWLLGTFYLLSPSIAILMTLCRQICEFPGNSAVKGLISCQRFSMGLASGDSAGVFHQWMLCSSKNSFATLDVCFGSLSGINQ